HDGHLTDEDFQIDTFLSGPLQSNLFLGIQSRTRLSGSSLIEDRLRGILFVELQPAPWLQLSSNLVAGETFDFANDRPADVLFVSPRAEIKPGRRVNLQLDHTLQDLDVEGGDLTTANLSQLRLVYNFNVRTFFRAILQYRDIERDPALYEFPVEPTSESLLSQLLLSYKLNPKTVLFLGYTENQLGLDRFDLVRTNRTFFFKMGYAWTL
ncbi:MAG: hypothetical protein R3234_05880, partial [Thermoanaerobaculia bacterium]|nr:hypothetical protein [Thermoanaerobaculia bacterium]